MILMIWWLIWDVLLFTLSSSVENKTARAYSAGVGIASTSPQECSLNERSDGSLDR